MACRDSTAFKASRASVALVASAQDKVFKDLAAFVASMVSRVLEALERNCKVSKASVVFRASRVLVDSMATQPNLEESKVSEVFKVYQALEVFLVSELSKASAD